MTQMHLKSKKYLSARTRSIPRLHLFVLPKISRLPSNSALGKMLGATIKITTENTEKEATSNSTNSRRLQKRREAPRNHSRKRQHHASLFPKKFDTQKKKSQMRVESNLSFSRFHPNLQSKRKEVLIWKPCLSSEEVIPPDESNGLLPYND